MWLPAPLHVLKISLLPVYIASWSWRLDIHHSVKIILYCIYLLPYKDDQCLEVKVDYQLAAQILWSRAWFLDWLGSICGQICIRINFHSLVCGSFVTEHSDTYLSQVKRWLDLTIITYFFGSYHVSLLKWCSPHWSDINYHYSSSKSPYCYYFLIYQSCSHVVV